ncbi:CENP-B homolog protein 2-like protein [Tanacetum coccineum]
MLMRSEELYKFCDGTLTSVRNVLHDIANNLRMEYLPKIRWGNLDRKRSHIMIKAIDQQPFERRLMRNLEKFVGGKEYGEDFRLLERTICHMLSYLITDEIRRALCKHNKDNPSLTQKQLQEWVHSNYGLQVSQATISNTVKRPLEYLSLAPERGDVKRHKPAKFPDLEKSLYEWILQYQEHVNMTSELIIEKAKKFMKDMYPVDTPDFTFSIGWLGKFKARYGIKNFRRFGESGSVEMEGMEDKLKSIRDKVDQFEMKDIFNMDETGLFFRLQPDHSLATMQLEGKKQDKERLTVAICCNEDGSEKLPDKCLITHIFYL